MTPLLRHDLDLAGRLRAFVQQHACGGRAQEAEVAAIESFRQDGQLRKMVLNDPADPPRLFAEEITEISSTEVAESAGLAWFANELTVQ